MADVDDKRKLNCKSIVGKYKVEQGTSCGAAAYGIAKQSLFNWIKRQKQNLTTILDIC